MKIAVFSDLHLEFYGHNTDFIEQDLAFQCGKAGVDVAVFAGDICNWTDRKTIAAVSKALGKVAPTVFWISGNHEYYGSSPPVATRRAADVLAQTACNTRIITRPRKIHIAGQKFVFGTMWYSRAAIEAIPADPYHGIYEVTDIHGETRAYRFSDFKHTDNLAPWVYDSNEDFIDLMNKEVDADTVVVTHHLPSPLSTPKQFRGKHSNAFFVCDQTSAIERLQPKLWIHGHTHTPTDYSIGNTRIVANPFGYPAEREALKQLGLGDYKPLVVEV